MVYFNYNPKPGGFLISKIESFYQEKIIKKQISLFVDVV